MTRHDFDRFVADNIDDLVRSAYLIVWDVAEAEDLVQETLLKVAKPWPKVSRMQHPVAYARRILVNLALDTKPKRSRQRAELVDAQPTEPAGPALSLSMTSCTSRSRRCRRVSARSSSCGTSWTFPKPRWRPHCSAPSAQ